MTARNVLTRYIRESSLGVTPVDGVWSTFPMAGGGGLTARPVLTESNTRVGNRGMSAPILVGRDIDGTLPAIFRANEFDALLESVLASAFSVGVLTNGTTETSYTFEDEFLDLSNKFLVYTGVKIDTMKFSWSNRGMATIEFTAMGISSDSDNVASLVGLGSTTAISASREMSVIDVSGISIGGDTNYCLESLEFTVSNNREQKICAGTPLGDATDLLPGSLSTSGSMTVATTDASFALIAKKDNQTSVPITFDIGDGTTSYNFDLHENSIEFDNPNDQGQDTSIILDVAFNGYNNSSDEMITITKT